MTDGKYDGYKTAEQIAVANNRSKENIRAIARRLKLASVIPPGENHRKYSPDDVKLIEQEIRRTNGSTDK